MQVRDCRPLPPRRLLSIPQRLRITYIINRASDMSKRAKISHSALIVPFSLCRERESIDDRYIQTKSLHPNPWQGPLPTKANDRTGQSHATRIERGAGNQHHPCIQSPMLQSPKGGVWTSNYSEDITNRGAFQLDTMTERTKAIVVPGCIEEDGQYAGIDVSDSNLSSLFLLNSISCRLTATKLSTRYRCNSRMDVPLPTCATAPRCVRHGS
jgi:uncharacterized protein YlaI